MCHNPFPALSPTDHICPVHPDSLLSILPDSTGHPNQSKLHPTMPSASLLIAVMYHPSSGWICHAPRQDPSHLDDDVTQYMWHGLLQPMASSSSSATVYLCLSILLPSRLLLSKLTTLDKSCPQLILVKLGSHPWILPPLPDLWHSSLQRKCAEMQWKRQTIGTLKETRCHLWKIVFKVFDSVRFNAFSLLVLY